MSVVHCRKDKYDVYIGRPSILGNPFSIHGTHTRQNVIKKFEQYARRRMATDEEFRAAVKACHNQVLGCWCAPLACHGDVILELAKEIRTDQSQRRHAM